MKKILYVALFSCLFTPSLLFAESSYYYGGSHRKAQVNRRWSIQPLGMNSQLSGHFKIVENKNNPAGGQIINLKRDTVNLDKENAWGINCSYKTCNRGSIEVNALKAKHDGNFRVARMFKERNYQANSKFRIDNNIYDILFNYHLWHKVYNSGIEKYYIASIFGVKASDADIGISGQVIAAGIPPQPAHTEYSEVIPTPYVGIEYGTFIGKLFYLKASLRYMGMDIKDYDASHYDYNATLSYRLSGDDCLHDLLMDVGYRYIEYDVIGKGNDIDLVYKGPYVAFDILF